MLISVYMSCLKAGLYVSILMTGFFMFYFAVAKIYERSLVAATHYPEDNFLFVLEFVSALILAILSPLFGKWSDEVRRKRTPAGKIIAALLPILIATTIAVSLCVVFAHALS